MRLVWSAMFILLLPSFETSASKGCSQFKIEPTARHLNVTMGGGLAYDPGLKSVLFAPGSFAPYTVNRIPLPLLGPVTDSLLLPTGNPFPARYLDRAGASEDLQTIALEADDVPFADAGDDNGFVDIYLVRWAGPAATFERISMAPTGADSNGNSSSAVISPDGSRVMFSSRANNLAPNSADRGVYIWYKGIKSLSSVKGPDGSALACSGQSIMVARRFSGDGSRALINCWGDVAGPHLWEVDVATASAKVLSPPDPSARYLVDADDELNTLIFFAVPAGGVTQQLYAWARNTGSWELMSKTDLGGVPDQTVNGGWISREGRYVTFHTSATNIIGTNNGNFLRSYVVDRQGGELAVVNGDGNGVPRAKVQAFPARFGDRMLVLTNWPSLSWRYDENSYNLLVGNPLRCDATIFGDGFEF